MLYFVAACILRRQFVVARFVVCASKCRYSMAHAFSSAKPQLSTFLLRGAGCGDSSCGSKDINPCRVCATSVVPDEGAPSIAAANVTTMERVLADLGTPLAVPLVSCWTGFEGLPPAFWDMFA